MQFHEIKLQVSKCSAMYFLSDTAPMRLNTDASDYGVGGHSFQTVDGIDRPVAFVSKPPKKSVGQQSKGNLSIISFMYVLTITTAQ